MPPRRREGCRLVERLAEEIGRGCEEAAVALELEGWGREGLPERGVGAHRRGVVAGHRRGAAARAAGGEHGVRGRAVAAGRIVAAAKVSLQDDRWRSSRFARACERAVALGGASGKGAHG